MLAIDKFDNADSTMCCGCESRPKELTRLSNPSDSSESIYLCGNCLRGLSGKIKEYRRKQRLQRSLTAKRN